MSLDDEQIAEFLAREKRVIVTAEESVLQVQQLQPVPIKVGEDLVVGFYRRIHVKPLTLQEARFLVRRDLADLMAALRPRIAPLMPALGDIRAAALLHVGLVLNGGTGRKLDSLRDLWPALKAGDYEKAHDLVMLSQWPELVGIDVASRRRVLAIARMLRTGEMPA